MNPLLMRFPFTEAIHMRVIRVRQKTQKHTRNLLITISQYIAFAAILIIITKSRAWACNVLRSDLYTLTECYRALSNYQLLQLNQYASSIIHITFEHLTESTPGSTDTPHLSYFWWNHVTLRSIQCRHVGRDEYSTSPYLSQNGYLRPICSVTTTMITSQLHFDWAFAFFLLRIPQSARKWSSILVGVSLCTKATIRAFLGRSTFKAKTFLRLTAIIACAMKGVIRAATRIFTGTSIKQLLFAMEASCQSMRWISSRPLTSWRTIWRTITAGCVETLTKIRQMRSKVFDRVKLGWLTLRTISGASLTFHLSSSCKFVETLLLYEFLLHKL